MSVNSSNFSFVLFRATCHANVAAVRKRAGSSSYISGHIFRKFSNTLANNTVLLRRYKQLYLPEFYPNVFPNSFCASLICISNIFHI